MRGPPPFAPWYNAPSGRRWRVRRGPGLPPSPHSGGAAVVAPLLARVGPRAAMRGGGCPHPPRNAKKMPHGGASGPPRPVGPRVPLPPWRLFRPRACSAAIPSRRGLLVVVGGWFWLPPPAAGRAPEKAGGGRGLPACGPPAPLGVCARSVLFPPPASSWRALGFPFAPAAGACRLPLPQMARRGRAAARWRGRQAWTECAPPEKRKPGRRTRNGAQRASEPGWGAGKTN